MDKENMEFKMRALNSYISLAYHFTKNLLEKEPEKTFIFNQKFNNNNNFDTFSAWQLETYIEMIFIKVFVLLEYLEELNIADKYKIDKKLLKAGLRPYVAHKGTHKDFSLLSLPTNTLVIAERVKIEDNQIFLTLLSGNHTEKVSAATPHKINLTEKIFRPHFDFIKENYPHWLNYSA